MTQREVYEAVSLILGLTIGDDFERRLVRKVLDDALRHFLAGEDFPTVDRLGDILVQAGRPDLALVVDEGRAAIEALRPVPA